MLKIYQETKFSILHAFPPPVSNFVLFLLNQFGRVPQPVANNVRERTKRKASFSLELEFWLVAGGSSENRLGYAALTPVRILRAE